MDMYLLSDLLLLYHYDVDDDLWDFRLWLVRDWTQLELWVRNSLTSMCGNGFPHGSRDWSPPILCHLPSPLQQLIFTGGKFDYIHLLCHPVIFITFHLISGLDGVMNQLDVRKSLCELNFWGIHSVWPPKPLINISLQLLVHVLFQWLVCHCLCFCPSPWNAISFWSTLAGVTNQLDVRS